MTKRKSAINSETIQEAGDKFVSHIFQFCNSGKKRFEDVALVEFMYPVFIACQVELS